MALVRTTPGPVGRHRLRAVGHPAVLGRTRGVLAESLGQPHLIEAMDAVMRRLGGTARIWRTDRLATDRDIQPDPPPQHPRLPQPDRLRDRRHDIITTIHPVRDPALTPSSTSTTSSNASPSTRHGGEPCRAALPTDQVGLSAGCSCRIWV